ncbi:MAG TPA: hypothetical protein PJ991_01890 [Kiritimatiellia bacterium]|nr:hypothetical protein [Kiritimatiellia bacterium]
MQAINLVLWVHIVSMVSVIGIMLFVQRCLAPEVRNNAEMSRSIARLANTLLAIGLIAGISYYVLNKGYTMGPHYNGVVGVKFVFLLGAGAVIGISKGTDRGDVFRWIAFSLMMVASLFGATL